MGGIGSGRGPHKNRIERGILNAQRRDCWAKDPTAPKERIPAPPVAKPKGKFPRPIEVRYADLLKD